MSGTTATDDRRQMFSKGTLGLLAGVMALSVVLVYFSNTAVTQQDAIDRGEPVAQRTITLHQVRAGEISVHDSETGNLIARFDGNKGGFVRGAMPALKRLRMVKRLPADAPYLLVRWQSGGVTLEDTAVGKRFYLHAFGKASAGVFANLLK